MQSSGTADTLQCPTLKNCQTLCNVQPWRTVRHCAMSNPEELPDTLQCPTLKNCQTLCNVQPWRTARHSAMSNPEELPDTLQCPTLKNCQTLYNVHPWRTARHFAMSIPEELPDTVTFSGSDDDDVCVCEPKCVWHSHFKDSYAWPSSNSPACIVEDRLQFQVSPCGVRRGHSGTRTSFSPVVRFSPVSIIPSMLHTHPSVTLYNLSHWQRR